MPKTQKIHKYEVKRCGGNEIHKRNGLRHRDDDLPAVIQNNGLQEWRQKGKLHRDGDQPARVWTAVRLTPSMGVLGYDRVFLGYHLKWYQHGKLHRDNDLPADVSYDGNQEWYQHGKLHRDNDLPAIIRADGWQEWYQHDKLHRDNGLPAIIRHDGQQEWYQHGVKQTYEEIMEKQAIVLKTVMIALYQRRILRIPWDVVRWELSRFF